ncbi:Cytochrome c oxidase copper chaperone [Pyricularia oryzae]|nr:Cytochrome c oxidase copper chaperone [Pyricularia oryzae]
MLRRGLILDLSIGLSLGTAMGSLYWYGYHVPRTNMRDNYYKKLEDQRAAARA